MTIATTYILPLGDSITQGSGVPGGYRKSLYQNLSASGYNVTFVGTKNTNCFTTCSLNMMMHEGHGGKNISFINENIKDWMKGYENEPDIILLHIGTNDFGYKGSKYEKAINRWGALIGKLTKLAPYAHVIASNLLERRLEQYNDRIETLFNPFVEGVIEKHAKYGHKVSFLDMNSLVPLEHIPDGLHPGEEGYKLMGNGWASSIKAITSPEGDYYPPEVSKVFLWNNLSYVSIFFSKPVSDESVKNQTNFYINKNISIDSIELDDSKRNIILKVHGMTRGDTYILKVKGITDRTEENLLLTAVSSFTLNACIDSKKTFGVTNIEGQVSCRSSVKDERELCSLQGFRRRCPESCSSCLSSTQYSYPSLSPSNNSKSNLLAYPSISKLISQKPSSQPNLSPSSSKLISQKPSGQPSLSPILTPQPSISHPDSRNSSSNTPSTRTPSFTPTVIISNPTLSFEPTVTTSNPTPDFIEVVYPPTYDSVLPSSYSSSFPSLQPVSNSLNLSASVLVPRSSPFNSSGDLYQLSYDSNSPSKFPSTSPSLRPSSIVLNQFHNSTKDTLYYRIPSNGCVVDANIPIFAVTICLSFALSIRFFM